MPVIQMLCKYFVFIVFLFPFILNGKEDIVMSTLTRLFDASISSDAGICGIYEKDYYKAKNKLFKIANEISVNHPLAMDVAVLSQNITALKRLFKEGGGILKSAGGGTLLHAAAMHGNIEIIEFLIEHGINIDTVYDSGGATPLLVAIYHNKTKNAEWLINNGADINHSQDGKTPLFLSILCKSEKITALLKSKGAVYNYHVEKLTNEH